MLLVHYHDDIWDPKPACEAKLRLLRVPHDVNGASSQLEIDAKPEGRQFLQRFCITTELSMPAPPKLAALLWPRFPEGVMPVCRHPPSSPLRPFLPLHGRHTVCYAILHSACLCDMQGSCSCNCSTTAVGCPAAAFPGWDQPSEDGSPCST